jgi:cysteine desulfurase/selenocysteine lyase
MRGPSLAGTSRPVDALPEPRLGNRSLFPDLAAAAYLNHAGVSPPSLAVKRAVTALLDRYAAAGAAAVMTTLALRGRLREKLARLTGVDAADVALTTGTTHGIQAVALSFPWRRGDRVLLFDGEFPANVTPWQRAAELFGLELAFVPLAAFERGAEEGLAAVRAVLARGARLVAVSAVQFRSGLAMPLAEMAALAHGHGAELFVDAVQALGAVPLDARAADLDYVACGAHKWLMAAEGAGFLYVKRERVAALRPALAGWLSHEDPVSFLTRGAGHLRYDRPIRKEAALFEAGSTSALSQAALEASVDLLLALGVPAIHAHVNRYLDLLEPALVARGFQSLRAADPARRSGMLSLVPPTGVDVIGFRDALAAQGVVAAIPDGALRLAPHWPNALEEVEKVVAAFDHALRLLYHRAPRAP